MIWFGGDYNPEQWDKEIWAQDDALMRQAHVNTATVGVFSWSMLEPQEGRYDFGWLDDTLDRLHANGVRVVLATPTASPPPWFTLAHPDAMPVTPQGHRLTHGSRDTYCAAAPAYRQAALRMATALAQRYAGHPGLALWHVHNEYGSLCWCDHAATAFRRWLQRRHGTGEAGLAELNLAWNTAFWSQRYSAWDQVLPPRATQYLHNPGHSLDFSRFWSDELMAAFCEQRDAIRAHTPNVPITTNLMMPHWQNLDLWRWSREVDVIAIDHYPSDPGPAGAADIAFGADRARSFNGGRPWLLMEHSPSTVIQADRALPKAPGEMLRHSLGHVARGSDSVLFFQWRAGRGGSELHHSAMVPHAGADTRVFREVVELGEVLTRMREVTGSTVSADVAILWDADAWWALETPAVPSAGSSYLSRLRETHGVLRDAGVITDFAHPEADLSGYRLVLAPSAYLLTDAAVDSLARYVAGGGHLILGPFSGVVDGNHSARAGGTPGGLRDVLGIWVEEFHPLPDGAGVRLTDGGCGRLWSEHVRLDGARVIAAYRDGALAGLPAITRHAHVAGTAWYVSTLLDGESLATLLRRLLGVAGVEPVLPGLPAGVEAVQRERDDGQCWLFLLNHSAQAVSVPARGHDLVSDAPVDGMLQLAAGGVAAIRTK